MTQPKGIGLTPEVHEYMLAHQTPPLDDVQRSLVSETRSRLPDEAGMQIAPEQGALMTALVRLTGARRVIEVGTFTGYSALCLARGLPADGELLCCDISEEWTSIARDHWDRAGVADRITLRIAPAADTLRALPDEPSYDLAFIDADKPGYPVYYEEILRRLRPGGLLLVDNVLWSGRVADPSDTGDDTVAIRAFNDLVASDDRVDVVIVPIADGLSLITKR
jgi:caffeoyl-CoA O-methyltransferase